MTSITFADVSKAFDRVWIRGLILKLERYGVKGELLCWLISYLSNICQIVEEKSSKNRKFNGPEYLTANFGLI